jgi:hypothetical protein
LKTWGSGVEPAVEKGPGKVSGLEIVVPPVKCQYGVEKWGQLEYARA